MPFSIPARATTSSPTSAINGESVLYSPECKWPPYVLAQIDRQLLEDLGTHDTRPVAPQLLHARPGAFVLLAGRIVVRVNQDVGIDEVLSLMELVA